MKMSAISANYRAGPTRGQREYYQDMMVYRIKLPHSRFCSDRDSVTDTDPYLFVHGIQDRISYTARLGPAEQVYIFLYFKSEHAVTGIFTA